MNKEEKIFADGFSFKRNENAPDFVVGRLSMKTNEAIAFLKKHDQNGWVNLSVKTARSGNHYVELDTYVGKKMTEEKAPVQTPKATSKKKVSEDEIPF
jgi:uncharacterized protein YgbK (DUF1537 family)